MGVGNFFIVLIFFGLGVMLCLLMMKLRYFVCFLKKLYFFSFILSLCFFRWLKMFWICWRWFFGVFENIRMLFRYVMVNFFCFWRIMFISFWKIVGVLFNLNGIWLNWNSFLWYVKVVFFLFEFFNFIC